MKVKLINEQIKNDYGANLLRARGIKNVEKFLNPTEEYLESWKNLENIELGVKSIEWLGNNGNIAILTDCDVDGYTSASIIGQYLKRLYPNLNIDYYIHEGKQHGFEDLWEELLQKEYKMIIAPDSSSNDSKYIKNFTCPVLILDHHIIEDTNFLPNMIVINNQISSNYKNKNQSGAGIVYQFCRALDDFFNKNWANDYIDLAALGCCGDMMSGLEIENQWLWKEGFKEVKNYFFLSIARKQAYSITGKMGATDDQIFKALNPLSVAFYIVPLINAMVRVGTKEEKLRMLTAFIDGHKMIPCLKRGAKGTFEEAAIESTRECINARSHQNKFKEEAVLRLEQKIFKYDLLENKILFVRLDPEDKFPSELNGLIAMSLSQKYKKPTVVARINEQGYIRGSARGLSNCELNSLKKYFDSTGLFEYALGHDQAFGVSIPSSNLNKLHEMANKDLACYDFGEDYYEVEFERHALDKDLEDLIKDISSCRFCWSTGNNEPMLYIKDLHFSKKDVQIMGKDKSTVKIVKNGIAYMKFFAKDFIEELNSIDGEEVKMEVVGKANLNNWNGLITPQIFIEQYEVKKSSLLDF